MTLEIVTTIKAAHIRRIDRASTRRIRQMIQSAVTGACDDARARGARPISAADDLTMHSLGPWIGTVGKCLTRSARREGISIVGGEMAQMPDSYAPGYLGIVVSVVSIIPATPETKP